MATHNPFASDPEKGEVFEQGYFAGFANPNISDFLPLAPGLLEAYRRGVQAGREDRFAPPEGGESDEWAGLEELEEHVVLHGIGIVIEKLFPKIAGAFISLVASVINIHDTPLRPLEPEFEAAADQVGDEVYVAICPRSDHAMVFDGVTADGYWAGPARSQFRGAAGDWSAHGHAESLIARCSPSEGTCGPVWPVK